MPWLSTATILPEVSEPKHVVVGEPWGHSETYSGYLQSRNDKSEDKSWTPAHTLYITMAILRFTHRNDFAWNVWRIAKEAEVASVDENKCSYPGRCESPDSCQITAKQHHKTGGRESHHHFLGSWRPSFVVWLRYTVLCSMQLGFCVEELDSFHFQVQVEYLL